MSRRRRTSSSFWKQYFGGVRLISQLPALDSALRALDVDWHRPMGGRQLAPAVRRSVDRLGKQVAIAEPADRICTGGTIVDHPRWVELTLTSHGRDLSRCKLPMTACMVVRVTTHSAHIASNGQYERTRRRTIDLRRTLRFTTVNGHVGGLSGSGLQARQERATEDDGDCQNQHDGQRAARVVD
jgi:hypothetical protein